MRFRVLCNSNFHCCCLRSRAELWIRITIKFENVNRNGRQTCVSATINRRAYEIMLNEYDNIILCYVGRTADAVFSAVFRFL